MKQPTREAASSRLSLLYLLDLTGVAVFALSGALAAAHAGMDLLGGVALAALTAIGGGTLRDLLLNRHPIFWISDPRYLAVILLTAVLSMLWITREPAPGQALLVADALGLALFAISGAQVAESAGLSPLIVVLMGTMTGTAGGMLRDVMSARVPLIFQKDIYASAAIAGIVVYLVLQRLGARRAVAIAAGVLTILALRLGAVGWGWHLPRLHLAG
jgi:Predicted membrane protein